MTLWHHVCVKSIFPLCVGVFDVVVVVVVLPMLFLKCKTTKIMYL